MEYSRFLADWNEDERTRSEWWTRFQKACEGLCNAFQYFMEQDLGPQGCLSKRFKEWEDKSWTDILAMSGCISWDLVYGIPAFEFVKTCGTFDRFRSLVLVMNAKS